MFPFPQQTVFQALPAALQQAKMTVRYGDPNRGYVAASKSISLMSWGENISIYLQPTPDGQTAVTITSNLKFGLVSWGVHDRNFQAIFAALDYVLRSAYAAQPQGPAPAQGPPPAQGQPPLQGPPPG